MKKLVDVLRKPTVLLELSLVELSTIIAEARYFNMLSQIKYLCESHNIWQDLPEKARAHLESAALFYKNQSLKLIQERQELKKALGPLKKDWVFLKGSAYYYTNIVGFTGRMMSDIDLLVAEKDLSTVEKTLNRHGWAAKQISNYDEKFYRSWAQEIPPLKHAFRQIDLDVHFNILPKTIKEAIDGNFLFEQTIPIDPTHQEKVLKPHAMLVHSAIHLFYESEFQKGLRDLYDIVIFIKEYGQNKVFWQQLIRLHDKIGNQQSLYLALRYCEKLFGLSAPKQAMRYYETYKPNFLKLKVLDFCFITVFTYTYPPNRKAWQSICEQILYLRGHLKRMPVSLLIPHLARKSIDKWKIKEQTQSLI